MVPLVSGRNNEVVTTPEQLWLQREVKKEIKAVPNMLKCLKFCLGKFYHP